ncbi:MAG: CBS domain-containing protein [Candidatus Diapherotrites archaeon]|nr:CBS domain-containing protein [Candidatus Diapherotrites archaeon]
MLVKDIMTKDPKTIPVDATIHDIVELFRKHRIRGAPVVKKHRLVGIVTEYDLLDFMELHEFGGKLWLPAPFDFIEAVLDAKQEVYEVKKEFEKLRNATAEKVMSTDVVTVAPTAHVSEVADLMTEGNLTHVPVVEDDKLVGLVTRSDLIKSLL